MPLLDDGAAVALAGPLPHDVESARAVEPVGADAVAAAEKAAADAEARAVAVEEDGFRGKAPAVTVLSAREDARLAGLRARGARQAHDRHVAAQRILGLHEVGEKARAHAEALNGVRREVADHVGEIDSHAKAARDLLREWSAKLGDLIAEAHALAPQKPAPGMVPHASSGNVYAAVDGSPATFVVGSTVLRPVNIADAVEVHELDAAIGAAVTATRPHDPATRLLIHPGGSDHPDASGPVRPRTAAPGLG